MTEYFVESSIHIFRAYVFTNFRADFLEDYRRNFGGNVDLFESSRSVLLNKIVINWSKIDFEPVKRYFAYWSCVFGSFSDYSVYGTQN